MADSNEHVTYSNEVLEPLLQRKQSAPEPVSAALENALSDTSLSYFNRLRKATFIELNTLFRLAGPAVVVYLLNNIISMSTQIFCGHLGNLELAAASLGNTGIQVFACGLMVNKFILYHLFYPHMYMKIFDDKNDENDLVCS